MCRVFIKMLFFLTLSTFVIGAFCDVCVDQSLVDRQPDYYWRNYFGLVPLDAISAGFSSNGSMTYVAQLPVWTFPGTFIGNIYAGSGDATLTVGGKIVEDGYIKILCSPLWPLYTWVATDPDNMLTLTQYNWVIGGAQGNPTQFAYVGRAVYQGQLQVGRVFPGTSVQRGLWLFNNLGAEVRLQSFELLVIQK